MERQSPISWDVSPIERDDDGLYVPEFFTGPDGFGRDVGDGMLPHEIALAVTVTELIPTMLAATAIRGHEAYWADIGSVQGLADGYFRVVDPETIPEELGWPYGSDPTFRYETWERMLKQEFVYQMAVLGDIAVNCWE